MKVNRLPIVKTETLVKRPNSPFFVKTTKRVVSPNAFKWYVIGRYGYDMKNEELKKMYADGRLIPVIFKYDHNDREKMGVEMADEV